MKIDPFIIRFILKILLFVVFSTNIPFLHAQKGAPFLHNYYAKDYNADLRDQRLELAGSKNNSVALDGRGLIYFANDKGILEYDGASWRLVSVPNGVVPKYIYSDKIGRIFVAAKNEFGILTPDSIGRMRYISLSRKLKNKIQFGEIEHLFSYDNDIYFVADNHVFRSNFNLEVTNITFNKGKAISTIERLIHVPEWGVVSINGNTATSVEGLVGAEHSQKKIIDILEYSAGHVLFVLETGLFKFDGQKVTPFKTNNDYFLKNNSITDAVILPDGKFIVGTARGGLAWISATGIFELVLDRVGGLPSQSINGLTVDKEGGLWVCTNEGITRAEVVSPLTKFEATSELTGSVQSIIFQNNTLYVATSMGLYYLNNKTQKFMSIKGVVSNAWALESLNDHLYAATGFGVYRIKGDSALLVSRTPARSLSRSPLNNKLYVGLYNGIGLVTESKKVVKTKKKIKTSGKKTKQDSNSQEDFSTNDTSSVKQPFGEIEVVGYASEASFEILDTTLGPVSQMAFEGGSRAWIYTESGLRIISFGKDSIIFRGYAPKGLPEGEVRIFKTTHGLVFGTIKGLYRYSVDQKQMIPYHWLGTDFEGEQINYLFQDSKSGNVLLSGKTGLAFGKWEAKSKKFSWRFTEFQRLSEVLVNHVFSGRDGAQWIGTERGIIHFDPAKEKNYFKPYNTILRKVEGKFSNSWKLIFGGAFSGANNEPVVGQDSINRAFTSKLQDVSHIRFQFAAPYFEGEAGCMYRHRLLGPTTTSDWSQWSTNTTVEYPITANGEYTFEVMAQNLYHNDSRVSQFSFIIQPKWYETPVAKTGGFILSVLLIGGIVFGLVRFQTIRLKRKNEELQKAIDLATEDIRKEKQKSENLLLNILPKQIAEELKVRDYTEAKEYSLVTVLFTDFKGFTNVAEKLTPNQLIEELNICFSAFDEIIGKYGIEKIKTIGDAYMCAGGIPDINFTNPLDVILAGLEIQAFMRKMTRIKAEKGEVYWQLRVGIHTGELVAGVVGKKKFAYDIWGDTVNTASRMESSGEPMKVNISGTTYELVSDFFITTYRGQLPAKNKGNIDMYFVERLKPEFSQDTDGEVPNDLYWEAYKQLAKKLSSKYA